MGLIMGMTRFTRRNFLKEPASRRSRWRGGASPAARRAAPRQPRQPSRHRAAHPVAWRRRPTSSRGYGAAGASCAIEAAANGASVIILESAAGRRRCGGATMGARRRSSRRSIDDSADALYDWVSDRNGRHVQQRDRPCVRRRGRTERRLARRACGGVPGPAVLEVAIRGQQRGRRGTPQRRRAPPDATGCEYEKFGVTGR